MWERGGHGTKCFCATYRRGIGSVPCGTAISLPASPPQHHCDRQMWPGHVAELEVPPCPAEGNMAIMHMGGVTLKTSVLEADSENGAETWKIRRRKVSWSIQGPGRVGAPESCLFLGWEGGTGWQAGTGLRHIPGLWRAVTADGTAVLGAPWQGRSSTGGTHPAWRGWQPPSPRREQSRIHT